MNPDDSPSFSWSSQFPGPKQSGEIIVASGASEFPQGRLAINIRVSFLKLDYVFAAILGQQQREISIWRKPHQHGANTGIEYVHPFRAIYHDDHPVWRNARQFRNDLVDNRRVFLPGVAGPRSHGLGWPMDAKGVSGRSKFSIQKLGAQNARASFAHLAFEPATGCLHRLTGFNPKRMLKFFADREVAFGKNGPAEATNVRACQNQRRG